MSLERKWYFHVFLQAKIFCFNFSYGQTPICGEKTRSNSIAAVNYDSLHAIYRSYWSRFHEEKGNSFIMLHAKACCKPRLKNPFVTWRTKFQRMNACYAGRDIMPRLSWQHSVFLRIRYLIYKHTYFSLESIIDKWDIHGDKKLPM